MQRRKRENERKQKKGGELRKGIESGRHRPNKGCKQLVGVLWATTRFFTDRPPSPRHRRQRLTCVPFLVLLVFPSKTPFISVFSSIQMSDSHIGTPNGDAPSLNGTANGSTSSPAPVQNGIPPVVRKKLMGYVGFANLPNQVHRKSVRKGFQFTCMVVGTCDLLVHIKVHVDIFCLFPLNSQANLDWESRRLSIPSSTRLSIPRRKFCLHQPRGRRQLRLKASVRVRDPLLFARIRARILYFSFPQISRRMESVFVLRLSIHLGSVTSSTMRIGEYFLAFFAWIKTAEINCLIVL